MTSHDVNFQLELCPTKTESTYFTCNQTSLYCLENDHN